MRNRLGLISIFMSSWLLLSLPIPVKAGNTGADVSVSATTIEITQNTYQYRITATNFGPDTARRLIISSPLPAGANGFVTHKVSGIPEGCDNFSGSQFSFCYSYLPANSSIFIDIVMQTNNPNLTTIQQQISISNETADENMANNQAYLEISLPRSVSTPTPTITPTITPPTNRGYIRPARAARSHYWRKYFIPLTHAIRSR